jgi:23S rRNA (pseudouridine1915-N3)-methyltransferase
MIHIHFVFVGKTAFPDIDAGIKRYMERLRHYTPLTLHLVKPEKITKSIDDDAIREREGERILSLVEKEGYLIVWDQRGKQLDSPELARYIERLQNNEASKVWMIIGGPLGVSPKLIERAHAVLALSKMTFPHDIARLLIMEQLYRAFTIIKGEPYHK